MVATWQTYRPNLGRKIPLALALVVLLLTVGAAAFQSGGALFSYVWRVSMPVVSAIVILVLLLVARPSLKLSDEGLVVVNILRSQKLEWSQILAVRFAKDAPWASLDLADGTRLNLMAVQNSDGPRARAMAIEIANRSSR
ncbi:hypothetical protein GALL_385810 [mine drainage metagenome]|uniref:Low molecular weight protein antigen 6 PH domain-containing protein n=1 Tax=mine drainage metagenome TaxID=410659 RepID=A0A1J5Q923_9ZZZZ